MYLLTETKPYQEYETATTTSPGMRPTAAAGDEDSIDVIVTVSPTVANLTPLKQIIVSACFVHDIIYC